jgi:hypothetical protein
MYVSTKSSIRLGSHLRTVTCKKKLLLAKYSYKKTNKKGCN